MSVAVMQRNDQPTKPKTPFVDDQLFKSLKEMGYDVANWTKTQL